MIKHKREIFLSDSVHQRLVIFGIFCGFAAIDLLRICFKIQQKESMGFFIPAVLFAVLSIVLFLKGFLKALEQKRNAQKSRHNFMQNGVLSHGKVTAAGGGYYRYYREHHARQGKSKNFYNWESCWWADIEYYDEIKGIYKRYRVIDLNKNGAFRLIGKEVDVYQLDDTIYIDFK